MRIATWNVNGIRAALRKGFDDAVQRVAPDVLLLQEVRARPDQLPADRADPPDWRVLWRPAERPGYAGTAIWSRHAIEQLSSPKDDPEGRIIHARTAGVHVVCIYLPSGSSGDHRQAAKEAWMCDFEKWARRLARLNEPVIMGGDFNIAHTEQDIFYAKSNEKNSGFLPHEREWLGRLLDSGWHDVVREHIGDRQGPYSWWSNRGKAREGDRGWRIDYLFANKKARPLLQQAGIDREAALTVSDHAPVWADWDA